MELLNHIILELAALFALFWTLRTKKILPGIISVSMIIGIVLVLYPDIQNKLIGIYVYMAACMIALLYGFYRLKNNRLSAYIIITMSASMLMYWLWASMHWHGNHLIMAFVCLIAGAIGLISRSHLRKDLGFLVILAADAIAVILENMLK